MGIIAWIILGGLAGWIGSRLSRGQGQGVLMNIIIGILGAAVGGFVFSFLGGEGVTGFNLWSLLVAVIGAVILLWVVSLFSGR